jgi:hypothetical protein
LAKRKIIRGNLLVANSNDDGKEELAHTNFSNSCAGWSQIDFCRAKIVQSPPDFALSFPERNNMRIFPQRLRSRHKAKTFRSALIFPKASGKSM